MDQTLNWENYEEFYQENYLKVLRYLTGKCKNYHDAEDLANDSFLYCLNHWQEYDPEKATRKTWLFVVVRSRWKNYLRDHRTLSSTDDMEELIPGEDIIDQTIWLQSLRDELAVLLQEIPNQQREAIILRYIGQLSDEEIAKRLTTSKVNVRVMIHRGLQRLNKDFADYLKKVLA